MTSVRPAARLATILTAGALVVALAGCSSDAATDESAAASVSVEESSIAEAPAEESAESADPAEAASGTAVLVDGEAPPERTITITDGTMSPATLTIAVGDTVTFAAGDDAVYAVEVGELDSATVTSGLIETFQFPQAGEYEAVEIISGTTAVIVVE